MKYVNLVDPQNPNWFDVAENIAKGGWDVDEACRHTGRSIADLKREMARLGANMQGATFVANMAVSALNKVEDAEKAAPSRPQSRHTLGEPMPPEPSAATAAGGLSVGTLVGVGLSVLAVGAGINYARNTSRTAPDLPAGATPVVAVAPAVAGTPAATTGGLTCTRGEAIATEIGRSLSVAGNSITYRDPDTQVFNTISWEPPPASVRVDDALPLVSWSTHNGGRPMEVQWESGAGANNAWGYGASSKDEYANEGRKLTRLRFTGGSVFLKGGVNYGSADESFRMQWDYYCKS